MSRPDKTKCQFRVLNLLIRGSQNLVRFENFLGICHTFTHKVELCFLFRTSFLWCTREKYEVIGSVMFAHSLIHIHYIYLTFTDVCKISFCTLHFCLPWPILENLPPLKLIYMEMTFMASSQAITLRNKKEYQVF